MGTKPNDTNIPVTATLVATNETKPGLATTANTTTTMTTIDTTSNSNKNSPNSEQNCNGKIINKLSSDANRQKDENDCTPNQSNVNDTDNGEIVNEYNENGEIEAQNKESKELNEGDVPNRTNDINNGKFFSKLNYLQLITIFFELQKHFQIKNCLLKIFD